MIDKKEWNSTYQKCFSLLGVGRAKSSRFIFLHHLDAITCGICADCCFDMTVWKSSRNFLWPWIIVQFSLRYFGQVIMPCSWFHKKKKMNFNFDLIFLAAHNYTTAQYKSNYNSLKYPYQVGKNVRTDSILFYCTDLQSSRRDRAKSNVD